MFYLFLFRYLCVFFYMKKFQHFFLNILWNKRFYVTNNYKTQEQIQGISGTIHYNVHPYFPLKNLSKKVSIIHGKIQVVSFSTVVNLVWCKLPIFLSQPRLLLLSEVFLTLSDWIKCLIQGIRSPSTGMAQLLIYLPCYVYFFKETLDLSLVSGIVPIT